MPNTVDTNLPPWQVLASEQLLDCSPWLRVIRQAVQLPTGAIIPDYLLTPGRDFSMIVALLEPPLAPVPELLLVRQYKHGFGQTLVEFPAGYLDDPGEWGELTAGPVVAVPSAPGADGDGGGGADGTEGGGSEPGGISCPSWVLAAAPDAVAPTCTRQGDPESTSLEVLSRDVSAATLELLARHGYTRDDLDLLLMHQANLRINEAAQKALGLPDEKVFNNIERWGNTTSATLPLAFWEARQAGKAPPGSLIAFAALGAGLHWGAVLLRV